jgi:hypothetical protein
MVELEMRKYAGSCTGLPALHNMTDLSLPLSLISEPPLQYTESENVFGIGAVAHRWHYVAFLFWNHINFFTIFLPVIFTVNTQCK